MHHQVSLVILPSFSPRLKRYSFLGSFRKSCLSKHIFLHVHYTAAAASSRHTHIPVCAHASPCWEPAEVNAKVTAAPPQPTPSLPFSLLPEITSKDIQLRHHCKVQWPGMEENGRSENMEKEIKREAWERRRKRGNQRGGTCHQCCTTQNSSIPQTKDDSEE